MGGINVWGNGGGKEDETREIGWGLPGGPVVKNPFSNAGDIGLDPLVRGLRSHMQKDN